MSLKVLLLSSVLGAVLFVSTVPTADAFLQLRPKTSNLATNKQGSWLSRHWRAAVFAVGLVNVGTAGLWVVQNTPTSYIETPAPVQINKTATAQSLTDTLPTVYRKFLRGEEARLVYYVNDNEARIGWLADKKFIGNGRILPYIPDNKEGLDKDNVGAKIRHLANHFPFLSNKDVVSSEAIVGKLLSSGYPMWETTFSNEEGQVLSGHVFAQIIPLEAKEITRPVTHVVLVTHHDEQELEADDRYFTIMPDDLLDKHGVPPLISVSNASSTPEEPAITHSIANISDSDKPILELLLFQPEYSSPHMAIEPYHRLIATSMLRLQK